MHILYARIIYENMNKLHLQKKLNSISKSLN